MKPIFSNATVMWNEEEIELRESLIREIPAILKRAWTDLNPRHASYGTVLTLQP